MAKFERNPEYERDLNDPYFDTLTRAEYRSYELRRFHYLSEKAVVDTAFQEGFLQGFKESVKKRQENGEDIDFERAIVLLAKRMKAKGEPISKIMLYTDMTEYEISQIP